MVTVNSVLTEVNHLQSRLAGPPVDTIQIKNSKFKNQNYNSKVKTFRF